LRGIRGWLAAMLAVILAMAAFSAPALGNATVRMATRLDISGGKVTGLDGAYEFKIPVMWQDNVQAERETEGNPAYVLDQVNFLCLSATRQYKPQVLMSLYVIDKKQWSDNLPYTPVLVSRDYIFAVTMGTGKNVYISPLDRAMYQACYDEVSTVDAVKNKFKLSKVQELWREMTVFVNGAEVEKPVVFIGGTYYLPLRNVCEELGYSVTWLAGSKSATIRKDGFYDIVPVAVNMTSDTRGYKMRLVDGTTYVSVAYLYNVLRLTIEINDARNAYVMSAE